jgi:hypothetical protein
MQNPVQGFPAGVVRRNSHAHGQLNLYFRYFRCKARGSLPAIISRKSENLLSIADSAVALFRELRLIMNLLRFGGTAESSFWINEPARVRYQRLSLAASHLHHFHKGASPNLINNHMPLKQNYDEYWRSRHQGHRVFCLRISLRGGVHW